jgi:thiol-disulfide isomerase/thioredoxin
MNTKTLIVFLFVLFSIAKTSNAQCRTKVVKMDHSIHPRPTAIFHNYAEWLADNPKKAKKYILRAGNVTIKGKKFQIIARDVNQNSRFDDEGIDAIGLAGSKSTEECAFEESCPSIVLYSKNLTAKLDDSYYEIESINPNGDEVKIKTLETLPAKINITFYQTLPFDMKLKMISSSEEKTFRQLIDPKAKYIYLNYWSTYCSPCIEEIPLINEFSDKGFAIVNICESTMYKAATKYINQYGFKGEHVYINPSVEKDLQLTTSGFPNGILYNQQGEILCYNIRIDDVQRFIDKL